MVKNVIQRAGGVISILYSERVIYRARLYLHRCFTIYIVPPIFYPLDDGDPVRVVKKSDLSAFDKECSRENIVQRPVNDDERRFTFVMGGEKDKKRGVDAFLKMHPFSVGTGHVSSCLQHDIINASLYVISGAKNTIYVMAPLPAYLPASRRLSIAAAIASCPLSS